MNLPKLISPMLDGCLTGEAISSHDGICCYPVVQAGTGDQFILKTIALPASEGQLSALLLAGVCKDKEDCKRYFHQQAQQILQEQELLNNLSQLEGFLPCTAVQITDKEDGCFVYLLSPYRQSVEQMLKSHALTHLDVVNLGLDLCAALAACRRAGYLYADLKPQNVFHTDLQGYRIGDLGLVSLGSLQYTALPQKFHSAYTPQEVTDSMAVLNPTVDTYALGLMLYQAYNGGLLPTRQEDGTITAPLYADYEMAEILLKACAENPADRWQDPAQMGQALAMYMQRNGINDTLIIPPKQSEAVWEPQEEFLPDVALNPEELEYLTAMSQEEEAIVDAQGISDDAAHILAQADALLTTSVEATTEDAEPTQQPLAQQIPEENEEEYEEDEEEYLPIPKASHKELWKSIFGLVLTAVILGSTVFGGWYYYQNVYLQHVGAVFVDGDQDTLTVQVITGIDESLLTVVCADSYGNSFTSPLSAGIAIFRNLDPHTRYTIRVEISGFHKLTGNYFTSFQTDAQIQIHTFTLGQGPRDGSVILKFNASGPLPEVWLLTYGTAGEEPRTMELTETSAVIDGLTVGLDYTFTLSLADGTPLSGQTQAEFAPKPFLYAQNVKIVACGGGVLSLTWEAPQLGNVKSWTLRCFNQDGYNTTVTTTDTSYTFTGLDHSTACTVEVYAEGMNQGSTITIDADPLTVTDFQFAIDDADLLRIHWSFLGTAPKNWLLEYSIDGCHQKPLSLTTATSFLELIPGGHYDLTLSSSDGRVIFANTWSYDAPEAADFIGYQLTREDFDFRLCLRPEQESWNWSHVPAEGYRNEFALGQPIGLVVKLSGLYDISNDPIRIKFVLHSADGTLLHYENRADIWKNLWRKGYGQFDLPYIPQEAGSYTLSVYFNGKIVSVQDFTVV